MIVTNIVASLVLALIQAPALVIRFSPFNASFPFFSSSKLSTASAGVNTKAVGESAKYKSTVASFTPTSLLAVKIMSVMTICWPCEGSNRLTAVLIVPNVA